MNGNWSVTLWSAIAMATIYCRCKHSHQGQISAEVSTIFYPPALLQLGPTGGNWESEVNWMNGNDDYILFFFQVNWKSILTDLFTLEPAGGKVFVRKSPHKFLIFIHTWGTFHRADIWLIFVYWVFIPLLTFLPKSFATSDNLVLSICTTLPPYRIKNMMKRGTKVQLIKEGKKLWTFYTHLQNIEFE